MKKLINIFLILSVLPLLAQKEANVWYFGNQAGLDFNSFSPRVLSDGMLSSNEGCASIADENGNLLFYSDGVTVWNKQHKEMVNGQDLYGNKTSTQSAVIVPMPLSKTMYYLFTVDAQNGWKGFRYSLIDVSKNGGSGEVVKRNILLADQVTEKVTAVKHANGTDIWVLIHTWNSRDFKAFLIESDSISTNPVISTTGTEHSGDDMNSSGYMKASPKGNKIALAIYYSKTIELLDFNNRTGEVSNPISLSGDEFDKPYGVEFSPNGSKLYASCLTEPCPIYQFDVNAGSKNAIMNSAKVLTPYHGSYYFAALQLGPDGNIYIAKYNANNLAVLEFPNEAPNIVRFNDFAVMLGKKLSLMGLPTFIQTYFKDDSLFILSTNPICEGDTLHLRVSRISGAKYEWTGPKGFTADSWDVVISDVSSDNSGIYSCHILLASGKEYLLTTEVKISPKPKCVIKYSGNPIICKGDSIALTALTKDSLLSYQWSTGESSPQIFAKLDDTYFLTATNSGACSVIDSVKITIIPAPEFDFNVDKMKSLCEGDSARISTNLAGNDYKFIWSTDDTTESIIVNQSGNYSLTVVNSSSCRFEKNLNIVFAPHPKLKILPDSSITLCQGDSVALKASEVFSRYIWSTGDSTSEIVVKTPGYYSLEAIDSLGCSAFASASVLLNEFNLSAIPSEIYFRDLCFGVSVDSLIQIINYSKKDVLLDSLRFTGSESDFSFTSSQSMPYRITEGKSIDLKITYKPKARTSFEDTLNIYMSYPCRKMYSVVLKGSANSTVSIRIPDSIFSHEGNTVTVPIFASYKSNGISGNFNFDTEISFNLKCFFPALSIMNFTRIENSEWIVSFSFSGLSLNSDEVKIAEIKGIPLISEKSSNIFSIKLTNNTDSLNCLDLDDGIISIEKVCQGTKFAYRFFETPSLSISPTPASESIKLKIANPGTDNYYLEIYDSFGDRVTENKYSDLSSADEEISIEDTKQITYNLNTQNMQSGLYQIVLKSKYAVLQARFLILH